MARAVAVMTVLGRSRRAAFECVEQCLEVFCERRPAGEGGDQVVGGHAVDLVEVPDRGGGRISYGGVLVVEEDLEELGVGIRLVGEDGGGAFPGCCGEGRRVGWVFSSKVIC